MQLSDMIQQNRSCEPVRCVGSPFGGAGERSKTERVVSFLEDIIELILTNEDGVVLLHALFH